MLVFFINSALHGLVKSVHPYILSLALLQRFEENFVGKA
jgi:hypothetical protein